MMESRVARLEALSKNERVVAVMKKLTEDPGAILTVEEDAALNAFKTAEQQLAAITTLAAQRAGEAQPKRQREELNFFKCDFGLAEGKLNKSLVGQRDTLVELWNKMQEIKEAVGDLKEAPAGERPTKLKKVEAAIDEEDPWEEEGDDGPEGRGADAGASGQINAHQDFWLRNICASKWTRRWVRNGFPSVWEDSKLPPPPRQLPNHPGAREHAEYMDATLAEFLAAGAAREWEGPTPPRCVLPLNVIPKQQPGKFRVLLDGRHINKFVQCPKFKYERLVDLDALMRPGELMVGIDLTNSYWQLRMHAAAQEFLGFEWRGKYYVFTVLPFGLKSAPWGFSKLMREFCAYLRHKGFRVLNYLDDFLFLLGVEQSGAERQRDALLEEFRQAGLGANLSKSQMEPVTDIRCLGFLVSSASMKFSIPEDRWTAFQTAIQAVEGKASVPARAMARVIGHAVSMQLVMGALSRLFTQACETSLRERVGWNGTVAVTAAVQEELHFWQGMAREALSAPIVRLASTVGVEIRTDASDFAWAGVMAGQAVARGYLSLAERVESSAMREMLALWYSLQALEGRLRGRRVHVLMDSTNARSIATKGSKWAHLQAVALKVFWWCKANQVQLSVAWIPREQNVVADFFSKVRESCDWQLSPDWFQRLDRRWGPHTVDRFASDHNKQLERFNSLFYCPGAEAVDCFTQHWTGENNWCNPPFALMRRLWRFMEEEQVVATVIVPVWPSAVWWPLLCPTGQWAPAVVDTVVLPSAEKLFRSGPQSANQVGAGAPKWRVMALQVSFTGDLSRRVPLPGPTLIP
ncbi:hypothetical protein Vafri_12133 [Volvox africanus]|uniref:Reverse transcriptase domain-containing protein n=2 Tax=Volvox africanus TaxID=51714 RepID=A0A8J4BAD7_9CHLO|nr:hypothetical protein Vafri_12133 [Volvox africanus]